MSEATRTRKKKRPPFSLRLTFEERARLERDADGQPLGSYIKSKVFGESVTPRARKRHRRPVKDEASLARVLALLGQSRLSSNLNQLAHASNTGSLPVTPDTEKALREACAEVAFMRRELLRALGHWTDLEGS